MSGGPGGKTSSQWYDFSFCSRPWSSPARPRAFLIPCFELITSTSTRSNASWSCANGSSSATRQWRELRRPRGTNEEKSQLLFLSRFVFADWCQSCSGFYTKHEGQACCCTSLSTNLLEIWYEPGLLLQPPRTTTTASTKYVSTILPKSDTISVTQSFMEPEWQLNNVTLNNPRDWDINRHNIFC